MCDEEDFDYGGLEADFCDRAAEQADYEETIRKKIKEMQAAGGYERLRIGRLSVQCTS